MIKLLIRVFVLSAVVLAFMLLCVNAWAMFVHSLKLDSLYESALFVVAPVLMTAFYWWLFDVFKAPDDGPTKSAND
jgi:hypothetical protein